MNELEQLIQLCARLGASPAQAPVMAAQLSRRADQLALERSIPRADALASLLEVVVQGRAGEVPARFRTPAGPAEAGGSAPAG
ncbi:MAG: hypothetical protein FJ381_10410 [Verrucomicrobia bacterium]|nr:hypothetical protein [Verrucomicrobiota bacterium]